MSRNITYWHLMMSQPWGRDGGVNIDAMDMLKEPKPVIGTGEWDDSQCDNFKYEMKIGDVVLVRNGATPLALCKVMSGSFVDQSLEAKYLNVNYRYVDVLFIFPKGYKSFPQWQGTLQKLVNHETESWIYIDKCYRQILKKMKTDRIIEILKNKKQIVLQGAPGTGKTYITASVALEIIGEPFDPENHDEIMKKYNNAVKDGRIVFTTFHQSMDYEDFIEGLKPNVESNSMTYEVKDGIFKRLCKNAGQNARLGEFDEAIEKLKKAATDNVITAQTRNKVDFSLVYRGGKTFRVRSSKSAAAEGVDFSASIEKIKDYYYEGESSDIYNISYVRGICDYLKETYDLKDYKKSKGLNYVLIIDEINRGNISKIFGELITLLEVDKRTDGDHTIKAKLPYSGEDFSVPSNLYIIGTMNTTDRSVGHIDYAIRRRFAFYTLAADELAIESYYSSLDADTKETALNLFAIVKDFLEDKISPDFDLEDVMVGHSYFMAKNKDGLKMKLEYEILPLIKEYEKDGIAYFMKEDLVDLKNRCLELF